MNTTTALLPKSLPQTLPPLQLGRENPAALADARRQGGFAGLLGQASATQPGFVQPQPLNAAGLNGARPRLTGAGSGAPPAPPRNAADRAQASLSPDEAEAAKVRAAQPAQPAQTAKAAEKPRPTAQEQRLDPNDPENAPVSFPASSVDGDGDADGEAPIDELDGSRLPWWATLPPVAVSDAAAASAAETAAMIEKRATAAAASEGASGSTGTVDAAELAAADSAGRAAGYKNPGTAQPVPSEPDATPARSMSASGSSAVATAAAAAAALPANFATAAAASNSQAAIAAALGLPGHGPGAGAAEAAGKADAADALATSLLPPGMGALGAPTTAAASAAALPSRLMASPGSPDFAAQLGASIATFMRQGLQQARLELNPAEMGPLSVQIQLDGTRAQVHLLADHALTRQALEQAMPQLAGSLREAGLTLTGGGVSDHPRQPPLPPDWEEREARLASVTAADGSDIQIGGQAQPLPMPVTGSRRGVVDLIA